jgi:glycine cleavage system H protein
MGCKAGFAAQKPVLWAKKPTPQTARAPRCGMHKQALQPLLKQRCADANRRALGWCVVGNGCGRLSFGSLEFAVWIFWRNNMIKYTPEHEWLLIDGDVAVVGITLHAQDALGDVVFVDLPEVGQTLAAKDIAGVVESVKAAADVYMPVSGEVLEVNEALRADPALANTDPMGAGWFFKVKLSNPAELNDLMDETGYSRFSASA